MPERLIPSPSVVVLVGPAASGKSTWAAATFRPEQVVSSDSLRAVVGESEHDLAASADAFAVLSEIVERRVRRRLTTVVDSLGLDPQARARWRNIAAAAGVPAIAVVFDTSAAECRRRNAARHVRVPSRILTGQLVRWPEVRRDVEAEPWHEVIAASAAAVVPAALAAPPTPAVVAPRAPVLEQPAEPAGGGVPLTVAQGGAGAAGGASRLSVGLHLSTFEWPGGRDRLGEHLARVAGDAEQAGIEQVWLMDHLRQIPQLGPPWHDLPDPYSVLAWLAASTRRVRLGVLVTPAFLRPPAVLAKEIATLDVLSGGRAMCGLGVGWFAAEYAAAGIPFPSLEDRFRALEDTIGALRALWGKGSPAFDGSAVRIPEALSYPRPVQARLPILVGGGGERRTLRVAARHADACNLFGEPEAVARKVEVLRRHCAEEGRDPAAVTVTHLSTVLVGRHRDHVDELVERWRPRRRSAERFAAHVNAGTVDDHVRRLERLIEAGVRGVIVALPDVVEPGAVDRLAEVVDRLR